MSWLSKLNPINLVGDIIKEPLLEWQKRKTIKQEADSKVVVLEAEAKIEKAKASIELAKQGRQIEVDYDKRAQDNMRTSWKDEYLTILIFTPAIMVFIPKTQELAEKGFKILEDLPLWYRISILGIIAAVFGLRWLIAPLVKTIKR